MKKILLFAVCCAVMLSVSAQGLFQKHTHLREDAKCLNLRPIEKMAENGNYNYRMDGYTTDDNYINCRFHYDSQRRLVATYEEVPSEYELIDSIRYNDLGQLVRLDGYQLIDNEWKHVYYIEYTYNNRGLIVTRSNYNEMYGEFELGGIYEYFYNEQDQITRSELLFMNSLYQVVDYVYQDGLLLSETWSYSDPFSFSEVFEPAEKIYYTYTDNRLTTVYDSIYDVVDGWMYYGKQTYVYDQAGNTTEYHHYDANDKEIERSVYVFDQRTAEETLIPWTPEIVRPRTFNNVNIYTREKYWTLDTELVLQYVGDYIYTYVDIDAVGLTDVEQLPLAIAPNPAENVITLSGFGEGVYKMDILDMSSRIVMSANVNNTMQINLSQLESGCYLVRISGNEGVYTSKLIVK